MWVLWTLRDVSQTDFEMMLVIIEVPTVFLSGKHVTPEARFHLQWFLESSLSWALGPECRILCSRHCRALQQFPTLFSHIPSGATKSRASNQPRIMLDTTWAPTVFLSGQQLRYARVSPAEDNVIGSCLDLQRAQHNSLCTQNLGYTGSSAGFCRAPGKKLHR